MKKWLIPAWAGARKAPDELETFCQARKYDVSTKKNYKCIKETEASLKRPSLAQVTDYNSLNNRRTHAPIPVIATNVCIYTLKEETYRRNNDCIPQKCPWHHSQRKVGELFHIKKEAKVTNN